MEEIRQCVVCGKEFVAKHWKSSTCSQECWKINRRRVNNEYKQSDMYKERLRKRSVAEKRRVERQTHQQDTSVWTADYGERQKANLVEQFARVDVQEILGGLKL
jgi:hypothetical protein